MPRPADRFPVAVAARQRAADGAQHVDRWPPAAFADLAIKHQMPVQDAAHRIGHRLVMVVAIDQHREDRGDVALAVRMPGPARSSSAGSSAKTEVYRSGRSPAPPRPDRFRAARGPTG